MLLPALNGAKHKARVIECIGNHNPSTPTCSPLQDQQNMLELERFGHAGGCGEARHGEGEKNRT